MCSQPLCACVQSTALAFDEVNEHNVYLCTGQPLPTDIAKIVEWMLNENFSTAYESSLFGCMCGYRFLLQVIGKELQVLRVHILPRGKFLLWIPDTIFADYSVKCIVMLCLFRY